MISYIYYLWLSKHFSTLLKSMLKPKSKKDWGNNLLTYIGTLIVAPFIFQNLLLLWHGLIAAVDVSKPDVFIFKTIAQVLLYGDVVFLKLLVLAASLTLIFCVIFVDFSERGDI